MSRHRKIKLSRSKAIVLATAGALSVATAASATAATWSPGTQEHAAGLAEIAGPGTHQAAAGAPRLVVTDQLALPLAEYANQQSSAIFVEHADQVRLAQTQAAIAQRQAAQKRAAQKRAAQKRAAQKRAAQKRAAELAAKKAAAAAAAPSTAATQTPAAAQPSQNAAATVPAVSGSPQQIAAAMLGSFGWSSSQFACLDPLWAHESGWSVSAYNAGSGAFGIPQALPGSRMASAGPDWQTNAATQIRWGLGVHQGHVRITVRRLGSRRGHRLVLGHRLVPEHRRPVPDRIGYLRPVTSTAGRRCAALRRTPAAVAATYWSARSRTARTTVGPRVY